MSRQCLWGLRLHLTSCRSSTTEATENFPSASIVPIRAMCSAHYFVGCLTLDMCAGQKFLERKRKETRSILKKIFLFPVFSLIFSYLNGLLSFFLSCEQLTRFLPFFPFLPLSTFSNPFQIFNASKFGHLRSGFERKFSKPVQHRSTTYSLLFLKSFLAFVEPVFVGIKEKRVS